MRRLLVFLTLLQFGATACDFPSVLSTEAQRSPDTALDEAGALLVLHTTGGVAGVDQLLAVDESGKVTYVDRFHPGAQWVIKLSSRELHELVAFLLERDFFEFDAEYFDPQVDDAFHFAITFNHDQRAKTLATDGFAAPKELEEIVETLIALERRVRDQTISLHVELGAEEIHAGEEVTLTLLVTNESDGPVTLHFNSGQIFDFYVTRETVATRPVPSRDFFWNWAYAMGFTQVLQELNLPVGETRSYRVTWDGRDNDGVQLAGQFVIGAELVSRPGGRPSHQRLTIISN